ncbi:translation initiation factor [Ferruginibacter lapsinanis]|uniref:translation initiation factor n=1 Tax=Ferruginibacter lapsinanis TaxID=563172 RepID=UPI001E4CD1C7|nr:translation initiation factor [Ferruginibacter lapsinanis]UEG51168.1 translation initiation factor [Ferruginibacter lapsinanis]
MAGKKINSFGGLVYSTDPNFKPESVNEEEQETLLPAQQKIKVRLDKKHRAGKAVTLVEGFVGITSDMEELGKKLKTFCGTGGSVKDGEIIVQGDNRDKVIQWFLKNGYSGAKKIG